MKRVRWCGQLLTAVLCLVIWHRAEGQDEGRETRRCAPAIGISHTRVADSVLGSDGDAREIRASESALSACLLDFPVGTLDMRLGAEYRYTRYEYAGIAGRDRDLHRLAFPLNFHARRDGFSIRGHVAPEISTSSNVFKDLADRGGAEDLHLAGRLEVIRKQRPGRAWLAGLTRDRAFGEDRLYPVIGIEWQPREDLWLRLALPDPALVFAPHQRWSMTARLFPAGHRWHVISDELDAEFDYEVEGYRGLLTWSPLLVRGISADISLGYEFSRRHRFVDDRGARLDLPADDEFVFSIGLRVGGAPAPGHYGRLTGTVAD